MDQPISDNTIWYACSEAAQTRRNQKDAWAHTPFATVSRPPCWKREPTCGRSRLLWGTRTWKTPRCICIFRGRICMRPPIRSTRLRYAGSENRQHRRSQQGVTRPPWEVADVIRRAGNRFIERYRGSLTGRSSKCCGRSSAAARPRSAATAISAFAAGIKPSPIIPAETVTVRSARPTHARSGYAPGDKNCCRSATSISSSAFPMRWYR